MNADQFKFRTEVSIEKSKDLIKLNSRTFFAGSCFADRIGEKMKFFKFNCMSNPYGNIYNPISLFTLLRYSLTGHFEEDWTFIENQERWFNYNFHSEVFAKTKEGLQNRIKEIHSESREFLQTTNYLILTLGTAFAYRLKEKNYLVANCHKVPSKFFEKQLLSPKEIIDEYEVLRKELLTIIPDIKVIFTVSPVRHIKDTLSLNNLSKSILRTSIHYIIQSFPEASYFPSFEMMMDDLRDYRFYKEDMIHPTSIAEEYIWEKFSRAYFDQETIDFIKDWKNVSKSLLHKPFHPESSNYINFLKETLKKLEQLNKKADFSEEIKSLKQKILYTE